MRPLSRLPLALLLLAACGPAEEAPYTLAEISDQAVLEIFRSPADHVGDPDQFDLKIVWDADPLRNRPCPTFHLEATLNGRPADQIFQGGYNEPGLLYTPGHRTCLSSDPELRWDWDPAWDFADLELVIRDESGEFRAVYPDWYPYPSRLEVPGDAVAPGDTVQLSLVDPPWTGPAMVTLTQVDGPSLELGKLQAVDGLVSFVLPYVSANQELGLHVDIQAPAVTVCEGPASCEPAWGFRGDPGRLELDASLTVR